METPRIRALVSVPLEIAHVLVVAAAFGGFGAMVGGMPDRVPVHWGLHGPNRWGSPHEFWLFGAIMVLDLALLWGVIGAVARRDAPPGPPAWRALELRQRQVRVRLLEAMFFGFDLVIGAAWLTIARGAAEGSTALVNSAVVGVVAGALATIVATAVVYGRRALRIQREMEAVPGAPPPERPARGWRWGGAIYYAPDDPAVWVPKRLGVGWTLNFARPAAWIWLAVLIGAPVALAAMLALRIGGGSR